MERNMSQLREGSFARNRGSPEHSQNVMTSIIRQHVYPSSVMLGCLQLSRLA